MSLTSKYDNSHHCLPEPLLALPKLRQLLVRFPSLTGIQNAVSKLTSLEVLRVEGLQQTLLIEPGVLLDPAALLCELFFKPQQQSLLVRCYDRYAAAGLCRMVFLQDAGMPHALTGQHLLLSSGLGQLGRLRSLSFKDCSWLGDQGANRPPWCPSLTGLTSLTELVFDHCPMLNTLPDAVRSPLLSVAPCPVCLAVLSRTFG